MNRTQGAVLAIGAAPVIGLLCFQSATPLQAFAPPDKDVIVVKGETNPVPVTGNISVSGTSTVSATLAATQSGPWTVGAAQAGTWSVGINPAQNTVELAPGTSFSHDSTFGIMNESQTLDLGPFDTSGLRQLRIMGHAINGDIRYQVLSDFSNWITMKLDEFTANGEDGLSTVTRVYDMPHPTSRSASPSPVRAGRTTSSCSSAGSGPRPGRREAAGARGERADVA